MGEVMLTEKQRFSERLNSVLDDIGFPRLGHGRQSALADLLEVTPDQVSSWLKGEGYPKTSKLVKIAQHVGVRSNWLLSGAGEKFSSDDDIEELKSSIQARRSKQPASKEDDSLLSQEAFEVALCWMQLPPLQQQAMKKAMQQLALVNEGED